MVRTRNLKKILLLLFTATLMGCPPSNEKPGMAIRSALYADMAILLNLNVKSAVEVKYSVQEVSGDLVKKAFMYYEEMIVNDESKSVVLNSYNTDKTLNWKRTFIFDNANLTDVRTDSSDGILINRITYWYDESGNLLEMNEYAGDSSPLYKTTYWYDNNLNMLVVNEYSFDLKALDKPPPGIQHEGKTTYKSNNKGQWTESIQLKDEVIVSENHYTYDDAGYVIVEKHFVKDTVSAATHAPKITYRYDLKDRLLEQIDYLANDELSARNIYTYDENGNRTAWINDSYTGDYARHTYKYELDKHGIWTKQTEYFSKQVQETGTPVAVTEREIKYRD